MPKRTTAATAPRNPDPLLTVREAVTYSGLSEATVRRRIETGSLPAVRFGARVIRVRLSDLDRYLATGDPA